MKVLIDSNVYISIINEEEISHFESLKLLEELKSQKAKLFTSNYVISEWLTVLSQRFNHNAINNDISYVDCTNIAFCEKYKLDKIITFDNSLIKLFDNINS